MEEESDNNYAALATTMKIEDITSCEQNQVILQRLKDNDPTLTKLKIILISGSSYYDNVYVPRDGEDLGWLGYYIGQNTKLQDLFMNARNNTDIFYRELSHNRSIQNITIYNVIGRMFQPMDSFFKNNSNLTYIKILRRQPADIFDDHFFSRELKNYTKSLRRLYLTLTFFDRALDIITSLNMHPQLEEIGLESMNIGNNGCTALSTLLRSTTQLQKLYLENNNIDDQGIDSLVHTIKLANVSSINQLQKLELSTNQSVTIRGWKQVASLLEMPNCIEVLDISHNNIGNEGARIFADALVKNSTLKTLDLSRCDITNEGWAPFLKLLCDKSTVNNTYLSNHTLQNVGNQVVGAVKEHLNRRGGEPSKVVMAKILRHHSHFDVQPFFEWELKVLPLMLDWFARAADCTTEYEEKIRRMKLSVVYDFIREFPMLYIWFMTRKEISDYTALEEKLLEEGRTSSILKQLAGRTSSTLEHLEKIREFKARALVRLASERTEPQYPILLNRILSDDPLEPIVESCDEESEEGGSGASTQATLDARDAEDSRDSSGLATRRQSPRTTVSYKGSGSEAASHSDAVVATGQLSASIGLCGAAENQKTSNQINHHNQPLLNMENKDADGGDASQGRRQSKQFFTISG